MSNIIKIIQENIWLFGHCQENQPFGSIAFYNGIICGYQNKNEATYEITADSLIIYTIDKQINTVFKFSDFKEDKWEGKCHFQGHPGHYLSINRNHPVYIKWNPKFIDVAKENRFYFQHFRQIENVYNEHSVITAYPNANVEPGAALAQGLLTSIGRFSFLVGNNTTNLKIGRFSSIAVGVKTFGVPHPTTWLCSNPVFYTKNSQYVYKETTGFDFATNLYFEENPNYVPVNIGHDVWIGEDCILKPGITIGDGAIIAARSIVTKDVPPYAIVAGSPATIRKFRFNQNIINRLLHLQWWNYHPHELQLDWDNPIKAVEQLENALNSSDIKAIQIPKKDYCLEFMRINKNMYIDL